MLNLFLQTFHVISEAVKADEHKRRELCRLYDDTRDVLNQLDDDFMKTLEKRLGGDLGDFRTTLEENIKNLAPRDQYVVLVAGRDMVEENRNFLSLANILQFFLGSRTASHPKYILQTKL